MKPMRTAELREAFLSFYEARGHFREKPASLLPHNDPSLMFTAAGMVPFKNVFTGLETRPYKRATTAQPCVRAGGKHNDLENVGFTKRHQTFFEMLGNFSFGDYFKEEAIAWAWKFVTEVLFMPKEKLYVSVHKEDEEAFQIWNKKIGLEKKRIFRLDEDNFWLAGEEGPCGPCSEIFFDRGERYNTGDPKKDCVGGEGERYVEFYNLVFMQFDRNKAGEKLALPRPCVDTGMGLERSAAILQELDSNYEIDLLISIIRFIEKKSGKKYTIASNDTSSVAMRVIADHLRAISFLIGDGLIPSNEGAGYVLRRILRRAVRFGKNLGFQKAFLYELVPTVVEEMGEVYTALKEKKNLIMEVIEGEEKRFFLTLEKGLELLEEELAKLPPKGVLNGASAFLLYDTFGFPIDLTQMIAKERKYSVDIAGFEKEMKKQKDRSKKINTSQKDTAIYEQFLSFSTEFTGYKSLKGQGKLLVLLNNKQEKVESLQAGEESKPFQAIFDSSPFYGESGGQVGDIGKILSFENSKIIARINDVKKIGENTPLLFGELLEASSLSVGTSYRQEVPAQFRREVAANHTATHLLHWALREMLGEHVRQAGSLVKDSFLRLDFTYPRALSAEEIQSLEDLVNKKISLAAELSTKIMSKEEALHTGAIAFFGEKYGEKVRVLSIGDYSIELCAGTHVQNTSEICLFKIISEQGIAAGVRRIIAYTGQKAFLYLREKLSTLHTLQSQLRVKTEAELLERVQKLQSSHKEIKKHLEEMEEKSFQNLAKDLKGSEINGIPFIIKEIKGTMQDLRKLLEILRPKFSNALIVLGAKDKVKVSLLVSVSKNLVDKVEANFLIQKLAPLIEGKGGGKKETAQAGGTKLESLGKALSAVEGILKSI